MTNLITALRWFTPSRYGMYTCWHFGRLLLPSSLSFIQMSVEGEAGAGRALECRCLSPLLVLHLSAHYPTAVIYAVKGDRFAFLGSFSPSTFLNFWAVLVAVVLRLA